MRRHARWMFAAAMLVSLLAGAAVASAFTRHAAPGSSAKACADPDNYPAARDPSNPLDLLTPPGSDPLNGARFFVDGPAHGAAAGAIAKLIGRDPTSYPDSYSWAQFAQDLQSGPAAAELRANPQLDYEAAMLSKIAAQPEANRFSLYSAGGGPGRIYDQVHKVLCQNMAADPGSIPIFTTYFLYQSGYCESKDEILAHRGTFERQVNEMVAGIDRRPALMLLELDAIGSSRCMARTGALPYWEGDIKYEINKVRTLPHAVVYVEGGYADANPPGYTARVLKAVGVRSIRGFFTNDTHEDWTINEIRWAQRVSRLVGGSHFIVNTANNGSGPLVPRNRVKNGNEVLCNPAGRALGSRPTTATGFPEADAYIWTVTPGFSSGTCKGKPGSVQGGPPSGFWPAYAVGEASRANGRLGPGYPSEPY